MVTPAKWNQYSMIALHIAARGTTVVQVYYVKVVRSTTYSVMYYGAGLGLSSSPTTSLNNATEKPLTPWNICAPTLNQVSILYSLLYVSQ